MCVCVCVCVLVRYLNDVSMVSKPQLFEPDNPSHFTACVYQCIAARVLKECQTVSNTMVMPSLVYRVGLDTHRPP